MTTNALEVNNLSAHIGDFTLRDINLKLEQGTIMGLVGKNGAGKTTFVKTILDLIPRVKGNILFNGLPFYGNESTIKANIGVVFDTPIFPVNLKPLKIKKLMAPFYPTFDYSKFDRLMERFELNPNKKLSTYSKGMQMKFSVVMALSHEPDLLILDEPTAGLDPVARADVLDLLLELMQGDNKSILFSTHITNDLEKIADYLTIIDDGKIILSQGKDDILDRYALVQIEKEVMTDALRVELIGVKETAFGFSGLCAKEKLRNVTGVKMVRPTIEDIIIFFREDQSSC
jgi:ABC-2 type transport system ATP-binding protein